MLVYSVNAKAIALRKTVCPTSMKYRELVRDCFTSMNPWKEGICGKEKDFGDWSLEREKREKQKQKMDDLM